MEFLNVCYNWDQIQCRRVDLWTDWLDKNTLKQIEVSKQELDYILWWKDLYKSLAYLRKKYNEFLY